jgi:hypothetical protein
MATTDYVRARIAAIIRKQPEMKMSRTNLVREFGATLRAQAAEQVSQMLSEGHLVPLGRGTRGDPKVVMVNTNYPGHDCPCCGQPIGNQVSVLLK